MITTYGPGCKVMDNPAGSCEGCWIELIEPGQGDIAQAARMASVDEKLLQHSLDMHERPRIEVDDDATLVVIRAPNIELNADHKRYSTVPLGILFTRSNVVTVCQIRDDSLMNILSASRAASDGFRQERSLCNIVKHVTQLYMLHLKEISAKIQEVERDLAESPSNEDLKFLLNLRKAVTYFHAALKNNDILIDRIARKGLTVCNSYKLMFTEDDLDIFDDALIDIRQGIYMSKIFSEVLDSTANVYSSVISNSVNQIMKILTSLTVILMVPTLITSMYGMNIPLPLQELEHAFGVVAFTSVTVTSGVILFLRYRKML